MTDKVFELPAEPSGVRLRDRNGIVWGRRGIGTWVTSSIHDPFEYVWNDLVTKFGPLTVVADPVLVPAERLTKSAIHQMLRDKLPDVGDDE